MKKQLEIPGTSTDLSMACDDLVELYDEVKKIDKERSRAKEACETAKERVAGIMLGLGMETCRHSGLLFKVKEPKEAKPKVTVKEEK